VAFSVKRALTRLLFFKCGCQVQPSVVGITFCLARNKAEKWIAAIDGYLLTGRLDSGESQKLAGRLMWATTHLFHRCTLRLCVSRMLHFFSLCW